MITKKTVFSIDLPMLKGTLTEDEALELINDLLEEVAPGEVLEEEEEVVE